MKNIETNNANELFLRKLDSCPLVVFLSGNHSGYGDLDHDAILDVGLPREIAVFYAGEKHALLDSKLISACGQASLVLIGLGVSTQLAEGIVGIFES